MVTRRRSIRREEKPRTLRLTFSYRGIDVRLVSGQRLEMVSPPSDPLEPVRGKTGFWYELLDGEGRPLYRRVTENPIRFSTEVRSDQSDRPLRRETIAQPEGMFVLLLPELDQGRTLVFFSSPLEIRRASDPAGEVARFDLTRLPGDPTSRP